MGSSHSKRLVEHIKRRGGNFKCVADISISGARVLDIKRKFKQENVNFRADVPLLIFIGGNDILNGAEVDQVKIQYLSLVRLLRRRLAKIFLFLICLPIFPRSLNNNTEVNKLLNFNLFLNSLGNNTTIIIPLNLHLTSIEHFHQFYPKSSRPDLLHLNHKGYQVLLDLITAHYTIY